MDIIEAIKYAENGKLITNGVFWLAGSYINYEGNGVFRQYRIIGDDEVEPVCEITSFSMGYILANDWKLVHELKLD